ncbi:MAG: tetratricopeptide repeat protein [Mesorhizobium sp.]
MEDNETLNALVRMADDRQDDVHAQLKAAYACDKEGAEDQAIRYYEMADKLRVPDTEQRRFLICYGSSLRNVGRGDEAVEKLRQAADQYPERSEAWLFLALALSSAGDKDAAIRALLKAALLEAGDTGLGGFTRAVSEYLEEMERPDPAKAEQHAAL